MGQNVIVRSLTRKHNAQNVDNPLLNKIHPLRGEILSNE